MSRVILLEGPDGAGKTTLARALEAKGYAYTHNGLYPDDTPAQLLDRYTTQLVAAIRTDAPTVIDRSFLSEQIYGEVMRGVSRFDENALRMLTRLTISQDVREVICLPEWDTVKVNWLEKRKAEFNAVNGEGDYVDKVMKLRAIFEQYQLRLMRHSHYLAYNYRFDSISILSELSPLWTMRPRRLPWGVIGSPRAIYLIVGEKVNEKKSPHDLPFWDLGATSEYLSKALVKCPTVHEEDLAFTNACEWNGRPRNLKRIIKHTLPRFWRAIALGHEAAVRCEEEGLPYQMIPHPSYWRFKSKSNYAQLLEGALTCG